MLSCSEVVCIFHGDADDNADRGPQYRTTELKVTVTHAGSGPYLVIETDRWAFDEPAELIELLEEVKRQCFPLFDRNGDG